MQLSIESECDFLCVYIMFEESLGQCNELLLLHLGVFYSSCDCYVRLLNGLIPAAVSTPWGYS